MQLTPWIINTDGTDFHRLAYTPKSNGENELFGSLAWSPDGKYILITEGYSPQGSTHDSGVPGYLYAIPSSSHNVELNRDGRDGIIKLQTNYRNESQQLRYIFNGDGFWWLP
jgi:glucose/arabinose dehydrogenase